MEHGGIPLDHPARQQPWRWMLPLAFVFLNESISLTMLFPFVGYMVTDFGIVESKDQAGVYAGYIASMFVLGQLMTGSFWGSLSDKVGRRPALFTGLAATACLAPLFGLSTCLWQALLARFCMGLLNGNQGVAKAYVGDAVTKETQDLGFTIVAVTWGCGNIVGATAGGFLARPARSWPDTFGGTLFETYPYLLPCMASSGFAVLGLVLSYFFLPDLHSAKPKDAVATGPSPFAYVLKRRRCLLCLGIFFCISFLDYGMFEIFPLWAITTLNGGGLDWDTQEVGFIQLCSGFMLISGNLLIFRTLRKRIDALPLQRIGMLCFCVPGFSLFPFVAKCCGGTNFAFLAVLPVVYLRVVGPGIVFTLSFQAVNNMVRDRRVLGGVTGLGQQVGCLARVATPTVAAKLYAWGEKSEHPFPLDRHLVFVLFGLGWLVPLALNLNLSEIDVTPRVPPGTADDSADEGDAEQARLLDGKPTVQYAD